MDWHVYLATLHSFPLIFLLKQDYDVQSNDSIYTTIAFCLKIVLHAQCVKVAGDCPVVSS